MTKNYIPKEISWLAFNERVLQEADNIEVPLLERLKFMGIYSNNLDEYFRVRVATLIRVSTLGLSSTSILGYSPKSTLKKVHEIVLVQNMKFEKIYTKLLCDLACNKIFIINEKQLNDEQTDFVREYFHNEVRTRLMPFMIERDSELPNLTDDAIYLAIILRGGKNQNNRYALMEVPTGVLPRFIILPARGVEKYIIFLDDIIRYGLKDIFFIFDFNEISAYTIKLTKDAELEMADDISESYINLLSKSLRQRKKGSPLRFIYDRTMPDELLKVITKKLHFGPDDVIIPGNRYHNFKDFMKFPQFGDSRYCYTQFEPIPHTDLQQGKSIMSAIRKKDIMLCFPYNPFDYIIDLLQEASLDQCLAECRQEWQKNNNCC
jgi:polyphosphate kinase